jgi:hypothetical protein
VDLFSADLPGLTSQFATQRFVHVPGLIHPDQAAYLLESTDRNVRRRVECGLKNVSWEEQQLGAGDPGYDFFRHPNLTRLIQALAGPITINNLMCWTSGYGAGEYINPHRDRHGTVQVLVCLKTVRSQHQGGSLVIEGTEVFLSAGDAVIFEATRLEHHTTPLITTADEPTPTRVVLVGRYYA